MSNNLYMAFHPGDYLADTAHLSTLEHGAYLLLIMNYWQRGEPLPADEKKLRGIARLTAEEWDAVREAILEFFTVQGGVLRHKRIDNELERSRAKSDKARASAERSHSGRRANAKRSHVQNDANAERTLSETSANAERSQSERDANQDQDQNQDQKNEAIASSSSADDAKIPISEMVRRLEQATGWSNLPGEGAIQSLVDEGHSFEDRILPLARDEAARRDGPPRGWAYLATVVRDKTRAPTPAAKPVEMVWIPVDGPHWKAATQVKRESFLRQMVKRDDKGREGIWWTAALGPLPQPKAVA